jgi:hypothetical protein
MPALANTAATDRASVRVRSTTTVTGRSPSTSITCRSAGASRAWASASDAAAKGSRTPPQAADQRIGPGGVGSLPQ